jgi:hypothetical protein
MGPMILRNLYRVSGATLVIVLVLIAAMVVTSHSTSSGTFPPPIIPSDNSTSSQIGNLSSPVTTTILTGPTTYLPPTTTTAPVLQNLPPQVDTGISVAIFSGYSKSEQNMVNGIIQAKEHYPSVPFVVVINPGDGPGNYSSNISSEVRNMQNLKISVLGYVPTGWGTKSLSLIKTEISAYYTWYHLDGILIDQIPNWEYDGPQGQLRYSGPNGTFIPDYLSNITSYAKSLGMSRVFADAGTDVPQNFLGSVDTFGIFENQFLPPIFSNASNVGSITGVNAWHLGYNKSNFYFVSYNVQSLNPYYVSAASDYVSYLYITNGGGNQPYNTLSPYFDQLVATLASLVPIKVQSELSSGAPLSPGVLATVIQPDGNSSMGYTPFTFNVLSGSTVTISANASDAGHTFSHWSNGSTAPTVQFSATRALNLTAYYN